MKSSLAYSLIFKGSIKSRLEKQGSALCPVRMCVTLVTSCHRTCKTRLLCGVRTILCILPTEHFNHTAINCKMAPVAVQNTANGGLTEPYPSGVADVVHKTHMPVGLEKNVPNPGKLFDQSKVSPTYLRLSLGHRHSAWHA